MPLINNGNKYISKDLLFLSSIGVALCVPFLLVDIIPKRDTSNYYMPMIHAFAEGRYGDAYYPSIPPLFTTIGGIVAKISGFSSILCAQLVSCLFYILSCLPIYLLALLVKNRKVAICSTVLFLFCSSLLNHAGSGLLDSGKTFFLLASLCGIYYFHKKPSFLLALLCSALLAGLALIRGEGIIFAIIGGLFLILIEIGYFQKEKKRRFPSKSLVAAFAFFLMLSPWLKYQYEKTGSFVTDSRQARQLNSVLGKKSQLNMSKDPATDFYAKKKATAQQPEKSLWDRLFKGLFKGIYLPYFILLLLPAYYVGIKRRQLSIHDKVFLGFFCLHSVILIIIVGGWTQSRYIIAAVPPLFITASSTVFLIGEKISSRTVKNILLGVLIIFSSYHGYKELLPESDSKEMMKKNKMKAAAWLADNNKIYLLPEKKHLKSTVIQYHNGSSPVIYASSAQLAILNNSEYVYAGKYQSSATTVEEVVKICYLKNIEFIVIDSRFKEDFPEFVNHWQKAKEFQLLQLFGEDEKSQEMIIGFRPYLKK